MTECYPLLKEYCLEYNCELQIADMHWAMDGQHVDNHSYVSSCLETIKQCENERAINFIVSLLHWQDFYFSDNLYRRQEALLLFILYVEQT